MADAAHKQADAILAAARAEAEHLIVQARNTADVELAQRLMALDRDYRRDLLEIKPRLVDIVRRSVQEILDDMPEETMAERVVRRALRDLPARGVVLRCSPADVEQAERIVERIRAQGGDAIQAVTIDTALDDGAWRLEAGGVALEIGPAAQIEALTDIISASLGGDGPRPD